ncbi:hypothetical protein [Helicobacter fennelliae]|nr:hypothetical protein [Helicobacter fennelliae]
MRIFAITLLGAALLLAGCSNKKAKIPQKSPCACYDIIIDMDKRG